MRMATVRSAVGVLAASAALAHPCTRRVTSRCIPAVLAASMLLLLLVPATSSAMSCVTPPDPVDALLGRPSSAIGVTEPDLYTRPLVVDALVLTRTKLKAAAHRGTIRTPSGNQSQVLVVVLGTSRGGTEVAVPPLLTTVRVNDGWGIPLPLGRVVFEVEHTGKQWHVRPCAAVQPITKPDQLPVYTDQRSIWQVIGFGPTPADELRLLRERVTRSCRALTTFGSTPDQKSALLIQTAQAILDARDPSPARWPSLLASLMRDEATIIEAEQRRGGPALRQRRSFARRHTYASRYRVARAQDVPACGVAVAINP